MFLDVSDAEATIDTIVQVAPEVIIHLAAVNPGQGDDDDMWRVNAEGSAAVARGAMRARSRLVAVSTDVLHDGTAGPYGDQDAPTPLTAYGASKAAGERAILDTDPGALVVRTSLMYALDEMDRGTAGFARRLAGGERISLFTDVLRNPIWVETLADALVRLANTDASGTLNVAGAEAVTRERYAEMMLTFWGVDTAGGVDLVRASDVSDTIPLDVRLDSSLAEHLLGSALPGLSQVLPSDR